LKSFLEFDPYGTGEPAMVVLRSYLFEHGLRAAIEEDVRRWMKRIAEDAIEHSQNWLYQPDSNAGPPAPSGDLSAHI